MRILILFLWLLLGGFYYYLSQYHCSNSAEDGINGNNNGLVVPDTSLNHEVKPLDGLNGKSHNSFMVTEELLDGSVDHTALKDSIMTNLGPTDTLTIYGMEGGKARAKAFVTKLGIDDERVILAGQPPHSTPIDSSTASADDTSDDTNVAASEAGDNSSTSNNNNASKVDMACACLRNNLRKIVVTVSDKDFEKAEQRSNEFKDQLVLCGVAPNRIITVLKTKDVEESSLKTLIQD